MALKLEITITYIDTVSHVRVVMCVTILLSSDLYQCHNTFNTVKINDN